MKTKISFLPVLLGIVILLFVFGYLGYYLGYKTGTQVGVETGLKTASEKMEASGFLPPEPKEIKSLKGSIAKIEGNTIFLKANPVTINPLVKQAPENRKVLVNDNTKILKRVEKPFEEFLKEEEAFIKALESAEGEPPVPPQSFTEQEIKLADLKVDDRITVTAETNIKLSSEFTATSISVR